MSQTANPGHWVCNPSRLPPLGASYQEGSVLTLKPHWSQASRHPDTPRQIVSPLHRG